MGIIPPPGVPASAVGSVQFAATGFPTARPLADRFADTIKISDVGAVGDGATDDSSALSRAYSRAASRASTGQNFVAIDLLGKTVAISSTLFITQSRVGIVNGSLIATGTWSDNTKPLVSFGNSSGDTDGGFLINVTLDGAQKSGGVQVIRHGRFFGQNCYFWHSPSYGLQSTVSATNLSLVSCEAGQFRFSDTGRTDGTPKTGIGFDIQTSDGTFVNLRASYNNIGIRVKSGYNNLFVNTHVYSDTYPTTTVYNGMQIESDAYGTIVNGGYFDNSVLQIANFTTTIQGSHFEKNGNGAETKKISLLASNANEQGSGLLIVNNRFNGTASGEISFDTTGPGSWSTTLKMIVTNNVRFDGSQLTPYGALPSGTTVGLNNGGSASFDLAGAAASNRFLHFRTADKFRWAFGAENTAESGSAAGSNFAVFSYDDVGNFRAQPLAITRATGAVTLGVLGTSGGAVTAKGALVDGSGVRVSLGATYTVPVNTSLVRFTQASTVTASTVTLPTASGDGHAIQFVNYAGAITALTFSPSVNGWTNASTVNAYTGLRIRWDSAASAWYREE